MTGCRSCRGRTGEVVLDLGDQPAADYFPAYGDPGPDPVYPLQMWLCTSCGLAQLLIDPTVPEEPRATEPVALVEQAMDAIARVAADGWLREGLSVLEYGSPHGGSWLPFLGDHGLSAGADDEGADVVLDCFGLMHEADQAAALAERASRVATGGTLLIQYHSLATILRLGQWNSLRHGHYGYYSTTALTAMLATVGFAIRSAWHFELYGGTALLAATRIAESVRRADEAVNALRDDDRKWAVTDPHGFRELQGRVVQSAAALHRWLSEQRLQGKTVVGYGAASRAVALLCRARVQKALLPAVADASPAKRGRRMPGTDIPVISPDEMLASRPEIVLLFLPDLLNEVRACLPQLEAAGGRWVIAEDLI